MTASIRLVEVSPRDGLQAESKSLGTDTKLELIRRLISAGLREIEITAFVRPDRIPQLADGEAVCRAFAGTEGVGLSALVPNAQGLERASGAGIQAIAFFTAATEEFSQRNAGCSIAQSLDRCREVVARGRTRGVNWMRAYLSCAFGCPYEGRVDPATVENLAEQLADLGCDEVVLADTIGIAGPRQTRELVQAVSRTVPVGRLALHLHDTRGQALANVYASLDLGIGALDASVAGLGGCPYAPGAAGNLATEDLVYLLQDCGIDTGINLERLIEAGRFISAALGRDNRSRVGVAGRSIAGSSSHAA